MTLRDSGAVYKCTDYYYYYIRIHIGDATKLLVILRMSAVVQYTNPRVCVRNMIWSVPFISMTCDLSTRLGPCGHI